jgi:hypothetical protein
MLQQSVEQASQAFAHPSQKTAWIGDPRISDVAVGRQMPAVEEQSDMRRRCVGVAFLKAMARCHHAQTASGKARIDACLHEQCPLPG